jgi:hypothetical protein
MDAAKIRSIDTILYAVGIHYDPASELYHRGAAVVEPAELVDLLGLSWDGLRELYRHKRRYPEDTSGGDKRRD